MARKPAPQPIETDAIGLLTADHRRVDDLFKRLTHEQHPRAKVEIATEICNELTVYALIEEELFYPEAVAAFEASGIDEKDPVWEGTVEHGTLKGLIDSLSGVDSDGEMFEAHVTALKAYVKHHVNEEEGEMFPRIRKTGLDLDALGKRVAARNAQLQRQVKPLAMRAPSDESSFELLARNDPGRPGRMQSTGRVG